MEVRKAHLYNLERAMSSVRLPKTTKARLDRQEILSYQKWLSFAITKAVLTMEDAAMPVSARNNKSQDFGFQFAQIRLNTEQRDEFYDWTKSFKTSVAECMAEMALSGYKFSLSADIENECFIASYTQRKPGHVHMNITVSSRSDDWEEAYWLTFYKIKVLYEDKALPLEQTKNNWG